MFAKPQSYDCGFLMNLVYHQELLTLVSSYSCNDYYVLVLGELLCFPPQIAPTTLATPLKKNAIKRIIEVLPMFCV